MTGEWTLAFKLDESLSPTTLSLAPHGGRGPRLLRAILGSALPLAVLTHSALVSDTGVGWDVVLAAAIYWSLYLAIELYRLEIRLSDDRLVLGLRPFFLNWLSPSAVSLDGVSEVRTRLGGVELCRDSQWQRLWIPYPPFPTPDGEQSAARIARFIAAHLEQASS